MSFLGRLFGSSKEGKNNPPQEATRNEHAGKDTIAALLQQLAPFKRTAYFPITESKNRTFSGYSKFGGYPYLRHADDWPVCPNCGNNMQLFLQLNLNELPIKKDDGLIQLFYCLNDNPQCDVDCEAFFPFSESVVCRRVKVEGNSYQIAPVIKDPFEEKSIIGWEPVDDYPGYDELKELGLNIDADKYEVLEIAETGIPLSGDKLYGWPYWVQNIEYPSDRKTGTRMDLLFQLDSNDNLPYMFGDAGVAHLTQSKDNPDELAFGWACAPEECLLDS